MHLPVTTWAWLLVALGCANLVVLVLATALVVRQYLGRHRPFGRLARSLEQGDLDRALFHLDRMPGAAGREMASFCRRTVESGPLDLARDRFLRGYLATYPVAPLIPKLVTTVLCGTGAALPALVGAAGWADSLAGAARYGEQVPETAQTLLLVGGVESVAIGVVAGVLVMVAHRFDPGSPGARRRWIRTLAGALT